MVLGEALFPPFLPVPWMENRTVFAAQIAESVFHSDVKFRDTEKIPQTGNCGVIACKTER
jgi:hypothetical protein